MPPVGHGISRKTTGLRTSHDRCWAGKRGWGPVWDEPRTVRHNFHVLNREEGDPLNETSFSWSQESEETMSIMRRLGSAVQAATSRRPELGRALAALKQAGETGRSHPPRPDTGPTDRVPAEPSEVGPGRGLGGALALGGLVLGAAAAAAAAATGGDVGQTAPWASGGADQNLADRCASMIDGLDTTWG